MLRLGFAAPRLGTSLQRGCHAAGPVIVAGALFTGLLAADGPQRTAPRTSSVDVCALLTSAEIKAVLGEAVQERKPTTQAAGELLTSQCFFGTTSARSISLMLTAENVLKRGRLTPREYWRKQFHGSIDEQERGSSARAIGGVGEEAYWMGSRFAGALYVLRGNSFLRISIGGIGDEEERIAKSKALALVAIKRL